MATKAFQFAVAPSFTHLVLDDKAPVADALAEVLRARQQIDHDGSILNAVMQQTRSRTVGDLRQLTDHDWRQVDVPAVCRIYLKYVVRQSARPSAPVGDLDPFEIKLRDDFNYGRPIVLQDFEPELGVLVSMGFTTNQSLEALFMTGNKSVEGALELLFIPSQVERAKKRQEAVINVGRSVDAQNSTNSMSDVRDTISADSSKSTLLRQLVMIKKQVEDERRQRERAEMQTKVKLTQMSKTVYKEYLRSLVAEETIAEQLRGYRDTHNISSKEHDRVLHDVGITQEQFENMQDCKVSRLNECVVCLSHPKEYVVIPCMHVCLCEHCAPKFRHGSACPICGVRADDATRVFL